MMGIEPTWGAMVITFIRREYKPYIHLQHLTTGFAALYPTLWYTYMERIIHSIIDPFPVGDMIYKSWIFNHVHGFSMSMLLC